MKIVLGLIVLSFGVFGITSLSSVVANKFLWPRWGRWKFPSNTSYMKQRRLQHANSELKDANLTLEQAVKMGLPKKILDDVIRKILVEQELKD